MKPTRHDVELVTPCFLGGATGAAEWRAASIRGQLRWWFRAVAGAAYGGRLAEVREAETAIFGSSERAASLRVRAWAPAASAGGAGQPFTAGRPMNAEQLVSRAALPRDQPTLARLRLVPQDVANPVHYLAYGPVVQGTSERSFLAAGQKATFELLWLPGGVADDRRELFSRALWAWLACGGVGSRSRRGLGSLRLLPAKDASTAPPQAGIPPGAVAPSTLDDLKAGSRELLALGRGFSTLPQWTHFSSRSRILLARLAEPSWESAMEALGSWLVTFRRRYGAPTDARIAPSGPLANRDYAWAAPNGTLHRKGVPDRAGFGLPLPFNPKGGGETVIWQRTGPGSPASGDARRASPLLLHVSKFGEKLYYPVLTYLPAVLLPADGAPCFKGDPSPRWTPVTAEQLGIVDLFLNELLARGLVEEVTLP